MNLREFLLGEIKKDEQAAAEAEAADSSWWYRAPLPPQWHRCQPATTGYTRRLTLVERCACGAVRLDRYGPWVERNSRRKPEGKSV